MIDLMSAEILVVDDEAFNVEIIIEILESNGFNNVTSTMVPEEALELYETRDFDLILLDIMMPRINGIEVLNHFAAINKDLPPPVLVLTADSNHKTRLQALDAGARDFLNKPFDFDEIIYRIKNLIELHLSRKELFDRSLLLENIVRERTDKLVRTQKGIVKCLGFAAEFRDTETAAHTVRVGKYSRLLAMSVGFTEEQLDLIELAAPLHDVGKIGIPDAILLKTGKLEEQEWEIMKTHAEVGANILQGEPSALLELAQEIALTHHERWDGKGYPRNLIGENIPTSGRIVAIADVFDALTMDRPYKTPWTIEEATAHILDNAGTHFDPDLVNVFHSQLDDLLSVREQNIH